MGLPLAETPLPVLTPVNAPYALRKILQTSEGTQTQRRSNEIQVLLYLQQLKHTHTPASQPAPPRYQDLLTEKVP